MYTTGIIQRLRHSLCTRTQITMYNYTRRIPLAFISPCWFPFASPWSPFSALLLTWNPPSCDRIRPPRSQVACKLTSLDPTLSPNPPPPNSQNPSYPAPHWDDLRKNPASSVRNSTNGFILGLFRSEAGVCPSPIEPCVWTCFCQVWFGGRQEEYPWEITPASLLQSKYDLHYTLRSWSDCVFFPFISWRVFSLWPNFFLLRLPQHRFFSYDCS